MKNGKGFGEVGFGGTAEPSGEVAEALGLGRGKSSGLKRKGFADGSPVAAAFGEPGIPAPEPRSDASAARGSPPAPAPAPVPGVGPGVDRSLLFDPVVACVEDEVVLVGDGGACG